MAARGAGENQYMQWNGKEPVPWAVTIGVVACLAIIAIVAWYAAAP